METHRDGEYSHSSFYPRKLELYRLMAGILAHPALMSSHPDESGK
jgi:hypothetical protein